MEQISLKELIKYQEFADISDLGIIKEWFIRNNREAEGIELIAELSKSQAKKLESILCNARMWIPTLSNTFQNLRTEVSEEFALKFNIICNMYLLNMDLSDSLLEWAKETIPKLKTPSVIFRPALEWLKEKYGVEFKDKII